jgi:outer membrane lipoprotein-sorting protein
MVSFRSYLAGVILAAVALASKGRAEEKREIPPLITGWLHAQTNIQTWSADVKQIRSLKTLLQPLTATGRVWFAAPNQFRWEIGQPPQTIAVRKSDEMLVIYPPLKRAERYSFTSQASGPWKETLALLEAGFPRNEADLSRQFKIASLSVSNDSCQLILQPKSSAARRMMPQISISFGTNDFILRATELSFADGSTMRNEFANPKLNPPIDTEQFAPKLGPEYTIVEPMKAR